ncbi:hypothetical protein ACFE04_000246 [Oxalis oulophora]
MHKSSISLVSNSSSIIRYASSTSSFIAKLPLIGRISHDRFVTCLQLKLKSSLNGFSDKGHALFRNNAMILRSSGNSAFPLFCTRYFSSLTNDGGGGGGGSSGIGKFLKNRKFNKKKYYYNRTQCRAAAKSKESSLVEKQPNVDSEEKLISLGSTEEVAKVNGKPKKKVSRNKKKKEEPKPEVEGDAAVKAKEKEKKRKPAPKKSSQIAATSPVLEVGGI